MEWGRKKTNSAVIAAEPNFLKFRIFAMSASFSGYAVPLRYDDDVIRFKKDVLFQLSLYDIVIIDFNDFVLA